ncbi:hypothetical protein HU719_006065 [Pseudomonas sp. SWRI107]|uniref:hypothetical protein n=1 Tax=Pseudomonas farsensis TaxID=2745492 RepID=UPI001645C01A|nr:hypothetical protein [Pseudomonas farsensis]MBV4530969.1 hypothetical protein [Pseudomonas farsensis]
MNATDFDLDVLGFRQRLAARKFDVQSAQDYINELGKRWAESAQSYFKDVVSVTLNAGESRFEGDVLGRKFSIHYAPIGSEGEGVIEAVLCTRDLINGQPIAIASFFVTARGCIFSMDGKKHLDLADRGADLTLLATIAKRVINASSRA